MWDEVGEVSAEGTRRVPSSRTRAIFKVGVLVKLDNGVRGTDTDAALDKVDDSFFCARTKRFNFHRL